jgi:NADH-quinone oxidoreductase subunit G
MDQTPFVHINGRKVYYSNERNLLEVIRKAHIELPTFCYHSELSVYGACRLCVVEIEGRGIVSSCSTKPEPGLKVATSTEALREVRRISLELLLANHNQSCTSCLKSASCKLQEIARKLGVSEIPFKKTAPRHNIDRSSAGIIRDPNKCILCGDCVRACYEIQGIGAIDFAFRGHDMQVLPSLGKGLGDVSCVDCGQCARVCPTGALTPKSEINKVWQYLEDPKKYVVVQVAPAVRVALGELFGLEGGTDVTGQMVAALKRLGFKRVFDTAFGADMTVIEETNELLGRLQSGEQLPLITSCCPGWVKFAEFKFPRLLPNLSTCRSPQQMFGATVKRTLPKELGIDPEDLVVVSVMPCTAKKGEAQRPEFTTEHGPDVDVVITTQELGTMIQQVGLSFKSLPVESFDMPFGFKTGAGLIFGNSGGVSEAALRYAAEKLTGKPLEQDDVMEVRGENGIRNVTVNLGGKEFTLAVVHGLRNARHLLNDVTKGKVKVDFIEVMACPGGCVGGGGQPVAGDSSARKARAKSLYRSDKALQLHRSQDNPYIDRVNASASGNECCRHGHHHLHTEYTDRSEFFEGEVQISREPEDDSIELKICLGPNCLAKGSDELLNAMVDRIAEEGLMSKVHVVAHTKVDPCEHPVTVTIDDEEMHSCTVDGLYSALMERIEVVRVGGK